MRVIGIDLGTTTISAVVMEAESKTVLEAKTIQNSSDIRTEHDWEKLQDVSAITEKAMQLLDELLIKYKGVASIGLTGQMHGIVYVDKDGRGVSPLYTWQDGRGGRSAGAKKSVVARAAEKGKAAVASGYGLATHIYNLEHSIVPETAVSFGTIADYFGMRLTGRKKPFIHSSNAASMGFFDIQKNRFFLELLSEMGVAEEMLPEVSPELSYLGEYRGIPVTIAIGDNQASFFGAVGMKENVLLLNMGTGGQISVLSSQYFEAPGIEARPFLKNRFLLVGSSLCGGRAYAILERFFRSYAEAAGMEPKSQYEIMDSLAGKGAQQSDAMRVSTAFHGTRVNPEQRGEIKNLTEDNFTPEGLVYGVLEGMSRELFELYEIMKKGAGIHVAQLVASGNGYRMNKTLQEISEKMFQADLTLAPYKEEAACGAAISSMSQQ